ncbi:transcriptional regulator [Sphingomonas parva]|uniref:Transcriptional regulator n=2 Tax=Sphingomonas parva TaxID=2555898 RepID=A0A4Y8ZWT0_9SPHN|nr:transcriptional regulator [Sphingomonas parva]
MLRECSIPAALEVVGERWSFLILRAAFNGLSHFEEFQRTLGIARNILSSRLVRLVENGVLDRVCDKTDRRKVEYRLTAKGDALLPVVIAIRQWGEQWVRRGESQLVLVDVRDRLPIAPIEVRAADGRKLMGWTPPDGIDVPKWRC